SEEVRCAAEIWLLESWTVADGSCKSNLVGKGPEDCNQERGGIRGEVGLTTETSLHTRYFLSRSPNTSAVKASSVAPRRQASSGRPALRHVCSMKVTRSQ